MLVKVLCFLSGMIMMWLLGYFLGIGHSITLLKETQRNCAALFTASEQGFHEILQLKYLAMAEAKRSDQNIISQKYIDQLNVDNMKKSIMRNYAGVFPINYRHIIEYTTWEELEQYVDMCTRKQREKK